jgi:hypothetical protein
MKKAIYLIRIITTLIILVGIFLETGIFTTIFAAIVSFYVELNFKITKDTIKLIKDIVKFLEIKSPNDLTKINKS